MVNIKFHSDIKDLHGTIDKEYILVLLSDKILLKYHIKQLAHDNKWCNYKLIKKEWLLCARKKYQDLRYGIE